MIAEPHVLTDMGLDNCIITGIRGTITEIIHYNIYNIPYWDNKTEIIINMVIDKSNGLYYTLGDEHLIKIK